MFRTVLIANRGEIALRIARTCKEMGLRTVAVHSTADAGSAVLRLADEVVQIGPPASRASYLNMPAVIEAALTTGADALHPGYGFLSEDPDFAEVCEANGITFVGPPPAVMAALGDKAVARERMAAAGLPVLPGSDRAVASATEAQEAADGIGYPVILKAAAGGGGRGMSVVHDGSDLVRAYQETRAAAQAVFGDGRLYVEEYVQRARHVEIQILCDQHGAGVHLGERECSVQRRHQKLIEETPAPGLSREQVAAMGADAVRGALAAGYVGAGTVEFLVDDDDRYTFMEINTRIQVEHPVTEMVTGIDVIRAQFEIAAGLPLAYGQADLRSRGVAIECRVNAEDPQHDFRPTPGTLDRCTFPGGPFTRVDTHAFPGWRISSHYDSLLAKIIVWDDDRDAAISRMRRALAELDVQGAGVRTTADFLAEVLGHPDFVRGRYDTGIVGSVLDDPARVRR